MKKHFTEKESHVAHKPMKNMFNLVNNGRNVSKFCILYSIV